MGAGTPAGLETLRAFIVRLLHLLHDYPARLKNRASCSSHAGLDYSRQGTLFTAVACVDRVSRGRSIRRVWRYMIHSNCRVVVHWYLHQPVCNFPKMYNLTPRKTCVKIAPKAAYLCMAKCNDNSKMSAEAVSACMRRCEAPLQEINQVVQQEVGGLQVRLNNANFPSRVSTRGNKHTACPRTSPNPLVDASHQLFFSHGVCTCAQRVMSAFHGSEGACILAHVHLVPEVCSLKYFRAICLLQNRMQRCAMDCADEAKDTIPAGAKEGDAVVERAMAQVREACRVGLSPLHRT